MGTSAAWAAVAATSGVAIAADGHEAEDDLAHEGVGLFPLLIRLISTVLRAIWVSRLSESTYQPTDRVHQQRGHERCVRAEKRAEEKILKVTLSEFYRVLKRRL